MNQSCCPFCFGLGLAACVHISGCWNRPRDGEALVDEHGAILFDTKNRTTTIEEEHELLATILYHTRKPREPQEM